MSMDSLTIPSNCRQMVVNHNGYWLSFQSSSQAERYCRLSRLEIVDKEVVGNTWVITVKKQDSFI